MFYPIPLKYILARVLRFISIVSASLLIKQFQKAFAVSSFSSDIKHLIPEASENILYEGPLSG